MLLVREGNFSRNRRLFSDTNEALIITKDEISKIIDRYKPDVIVCDEEIIVNNNNPYMNLMNYTEFKDLQARDNGFYISGLIMPIYSDDDELARKQYQIISRVLNRYKHVIHVSNCDFVYPWQMEKIYPML